MDVSDTDDVTVNVAVLKKGLVNVPLVANILYKKRALFCCSFESPFEDDGFVQLELLTLDSVSGKICCCVSVIGSSLGDAIKSR
jgi:hypothetical protein